MLTFEVEERQLAALIVLPLALIGVTCNWTVALSIRKLPTLKNAFGRLTASQSLGDAFHSSLFAFYYVPMCFFNVKAMLDNSFICGHLLLIAYDISTYSHFFISLNRFSAIFSPIKYEHIFSVFNTNCIIFFSWTMAILPSIYLYIFNDCKFFYLDKFWVFIFSSTPVCQTITWYADFLKYNSIVLSIVIIDIITVTKVRLFNRKACLQAVVFVFELITYFVITPKVHDDYRWTRFFLSTVAWVMVHTTDGIITISFNHEFLHFVQNGFKHIGSKASGGVATIPHVETSTNRRSTSNA